MNLKERKKAFQAESDSGPKWKDVKTALCSSGSLSSSHPPNPELLVWWLHSIPLAQPLINWSQNYGGNPLQRNGNFILSGWRAVSLTISFPLVVLCFSQYMQLKQYSAYASLQSLPWKNPWNLMWLCHRVWFIKDHIGHQISYHLESWMLPRWIW